MHAIRITAVALLAGLAACAAGPDYHAPRPDVPAAYAATPAASAAAAAAPVAPDIATWWRALGDAELDSLVDRAVKSNLDLAVALERLQQARTYEVVVLGGALPVVDASAGAGRGTGSDLTKGRADPVLRSGDNGAGLEHINTVAGFDAVWELDLFGKFRREAQAARADTQAAYAARDEVLTTVIADVVRAYVDLRGFQVRAGILHQGIDVLRESLRIVNIRYERGITNELDVALARRELANLEAEVAPVEAQAHAAQYTLAVLLGEFPEELTAELSKPELVPTMPLASAPGVPLDLLKRRPDVRQAERELAASTARIGVATASLYPTVTLSGSLGSQAQGWGTSPNVGQHIWSFGPGAMWPLLDFGALDAQVDIAHLATQAQLASYRRTILTAVQQVDTSLGAYNGLQDRLVHLGEGVLAAQRAVELANERYDRGLTDFLNVVDAQRELYDLQGQYAQAQVAQGEEFVQLYKDLGGGWENFQSVPEIRRPQPAIVAAFRRALTSSAP